MRFRTLIRIAGSFIGWFLFGLGVGAEIEIKRKNSAIDSKLPLRAGLATGAFGASRTALRARRFA